MVLVIEHLHERDIIYRDLKPENVLIDAQGYIRVADFGLSRKGVKGDFEAQSICGTPEYLAPEIVFKMGHGKPVDWWTLGSILYELLVGLPPFYSANKKELFEKIKFGKVNYPPHLSDSCVDFLRSMLLKNPKRRLGAKGSKEVKEHPWFGHIDWERLLRKDQRCSSILRRGFYSQRKKHKKSKSHSGKSSRQRKRKD